MDDLVVAEKVLPPPTKVCMSLVVLYLHPELTPFVV